MAKKVNYRGNIQFETARINGLIKALELPVDPQLFGDFVDREVNFHSVTLGRMYRAMEDSSFALDRHQVLVDFRAAMTQFMDLLDMILESRSPLSPFLEIQKPRYRRMRQSAWEQRASIEKWIGETSDLTPESSHIVSEEEFKGLLSEPHQE